MGSIPDQGTRILHAPLGAAPMPLTCSKGVGQTLPEGSVWCVVAVEPTGVAEAFRTEEEAEEMNWK